MSDPVVGKFGKLPAVHDPQAVMLDDMVKKFGLQAPSNPSSKLWRVNWSRKVNASKIGALGNSNHADCTIASKMHTIQTWTAWTSTQAEFTDAIALDYYRKWAGYDGTPATDKGATIIGILNKWLYDPIMGHPLTGHATMRPGNIQDLKDSIWINGSADIGLMLPNTCISQGIWRVVARSGDGAPGSAGGHDVNVIDFDDHAQLLNFWTWGHLKQMSYDFFYEYCDEGHACVSKEFVMQNGLTPSDFKLDDMIEYLNSQRV